MEGLPLFTAHIGASVAKRLLRRHLREWFATTGLLNNFQAWSGPRQKLFEGLLYTVSALIDRQLGTTTAARKFLNEVITDSATETGASLNEYAQAPSPALAEWDRLVGLTEGQLRAFLDWFDRADERQRRNIRLAIKKSTADSIRRLLRLPPAYRHRAVAYLTERPVPSVKPKPRGFIAALNARMRRPLVSWG